MAAHTSTLRMVPKRPELQQLLEHAKSTAITEEQLQSTLSRAPERPELQRLLELAKTITITEEHLQEQRASFVYGNAPQGSGITKESARKAAKRIRLTEP